MQEALLVAGSERAVDTESSICPAIGILAFFAASNAWPQATPPLRLSERILITARRASKSLYCELCCS